MLSGGEQVREYRALQAVAAEKARKARERKRRRSRGATWGKPRIPAAEVGVVGRKVVGAGGCWGFVTQDLPRHFMVRWEPCDGPDEMVEKRLVSVQRGGERVDGERVIDYIGREVFSGGTSGLVLGFGPRDELFKVRFRGAVCAPGLAEGGGQLVYRMPAESVLALTNKPRANARRSSDLSDSRRDGGAG